MTESDVLSSEESVPGMLPVPTDQSGFVNFFQRDSRSVICAKDVILMLLSCCCFAVAEKPVVPVTSNRACKQRLKRLSEQRAEQLAGSRQDAAFACCCSTCLLVRHIICSNCHNSGEDYNCSLQSLRLTV